METNLNFKAQICTTREQSERLLSLGLKKETADMVWLDYAMTEEYEDWQARPKEEWEGWYKSDNPAWSLHRLIELYKCVGDTSLWNLDDVNYDRLIQCIGLAIKHNSFNKEYLENGKE